MARSVFVNSFIFQLLMCLIFTNETSSYDKILLEQARLCSLKDDERVVIKLGKGESSSALVKQFKYFERWSGKYRFSCDFLVKAPKGYGVYAVIQNLSFRRNEVTGDCKDYVQFDVPKGFMDMLFHKTDRVFKKFCGKILASETYLSGVKGLKNTDALIYSSVSDNGFVAKDGIIHVTINVAKEKLKPDEKLDISIAFTSFERSCLNRNNSIMCKKCEWIWEGLQSDKIQNCPYTSCLDEDFCVDLDSKNEIRNVISSGTGTKVSIGATVTIVLVLLTFACCVWISRKFQICCFDKSGSGQSRMEMNSTQRTSRTNENILPPDTMSPSAPPISEVKDLPPSYSSLFPDR